MQRAATTHLPIFIALLAGILTVVAVAALVIQQADGAEAAQDFVVDGILTASLTFVLATLAAVISATVTLARWLLRRRHRHA